MKELKLILRISTSILLIPVSTHAQNLYKVVPYKDTSTGMFEVFDLEKYQYRPEKFDKAFVLTGIKENYILLSNESRSLLLNSEHKIILEDSFIVKQFVFASATPNYVIVSNKQGFGVYDKVKKRFAFPPIYGDTYTILRDSILFVMNSRDSQIVFLNIVSGKKGYIKSVGKDVTIHTKGLVQEDLFYFSNLEGYSCLFSIYSGKSIFATAGARFSQNGTQSVLIKDKEPKMKQINIISGEVNEINYDDISTIQYSDNYFVLRRNNHYFLVDSSLSILKKFKRKPSLVFVGGCVFQHNTNYFNLVFGIKEFGNFSRFEMVHKVDFKYFIEEKGNTHLVNSAGKISATFPGKYETASGDWLSTQLSNGNYCLYNTELNKKIYHSPVLVYLLRNSTDTLFIRRSDKGYGYLGLQNISSEIILPCKYQHISQQVGNMFLVIGPGNIGTYFVDNTGKELLK